MEMIPVVSSNVYAIGYEYGVITVQFKNGYVYEYRNVNIDVFYAFKSASSKGGFVHNVLSKYPTKRIN